MKDLLGTLKNGKWTQYIGKPYCGQYLSRIGLKVTILERLGDMIHLHIQRGIEAMMCLALITELCIETVG